MSLLKAPGGFRQQLLIAVIIASTSATLLIHGMEGRMYCRLTRLRLAAIDQQAVSAGAGYLVDDPEKAKRTAQRYALDHGIMRAEIGFVRTAVDGQSLGMELNRTIPFSFSVLSFGSPNRVVTVTAWAIRRHPSTPDSGTAPLFAAR